MATAEVLSCVSAIISAFQSGADMVHTLRERTEKKKRRKEKDMEQAVEEKMLQRALMEGANKCQTTCSERRQRFGRDFEIGDAIATSALKDVMISLHTEIISALQIARAVENAELDLSCLHEAAITNKNNALRTLDELCHRLSMTSHSQFDPRAHSDIHRRASSVDEYGAPSPLGTSDQYSSYRSVSQYNVTNPPLARTHSVRYGPETASDRHASRRTTPNSRTQHAQTWRSDRSYPPNNKIEEQDEIRSSDANADELSNLSVHDRHDSAMGSDQGSRHRVSASITSIMLSDDDGRSYTSANSGEPPDLHLKLAPTGSLASEISAEFDASGSESVTPHLSRRESEEDARRAESAPEVLTKEFESMLTQQPLRHAPHSYTPRPLDMKTIHPAFRTQVVDSPGALDPEPERIWSPLQRPAKINNYHGFCKGAWSARGSLQEGLSITMISNFKGQNIPHWKCKACEFMSRGVNNTKVLPDQIYFSASGIRYRWVFLAKSHVLSRKASNKPESYSYGCVFCAAQGHETHVHEGLEALMTHITNKHKTVSLTPEVLEKTGCVIGGIPDRADSWDINVPHSQGRKISAALGEFVVSATTGFR